MKNYVLKYIFFVLTISLVLSLNSCKKNSLPDSESYEYLFSSEFKFNITAAEVKANLSEFSDYSPGVSLMYVGVVNDIDVYKLTYKTSFNNQNIQASGLVCFPKTAGDYPILCFQNGTNTMHSLAPTENAKDDTFSIMEGLASMGFIVVIPDYIGFGASSKNVHPYLIAKSTTQSILDLLRAVKEFGTEDKIVAKPTDDLFIFGYSQGAWATMQLQKAIETNYASEFNLVASSCGAGPYSLSYINEYITAQADYPMPYFLAYLLNSYVATGEITNPISDFVQEPYASKIPGLFDGLHTGGTINSELTTNMTKLLTPEYRTEFATNAKFTGMRTALLANSIVAWNVATPTRLYHGADDDYIPLGMSQKMYADFRTAGVPESKIKLTEIDGVDHTTGVVPVGLATVIWFLGLKK